jgi:excisionase family DNA binding protein
MATQKDRDMERVAKVLAGQRHTVSPSETVDLFTIEGTATRLRCSDTHVYRLINAGLLRAVDISAPGSPRTKTRVRSDDLQDYIDSRTRGRTPAGDAA